VTGLFATLFGDRIDLPAETLETARERLDETGTVRDARAVSEAGQVTAMHDATEGGLLGALHEMAESAGVRLTVDTESVPMRPGVEAVSEAVSMDPWRASTAGTLLVAVDPADTEAVLAALEARGTPVACVGTVAEGAGVVVDGEATEQPTSDSGWPVYERLLAE
jgi:hydrogenase expression/formation protein HypE